MSHLTIMKHCAVLFVLGVIFISSDALKVVYTRAYYGKNLGAARKYHSKYFEIVRKSGYITLDYWSTHFSCANYEANSLGDYMGFFHCNQWFEPSDFDYCCGIQGAHYCCPNSSLATPYRKNPNKTSSQYLSTWLIAVIVVAVLTIAVPALIYGIVIVCGVYHASNRRTVQATPNTPNVTFTSGIYPAQQITGQYPIQQQTGAYPQQPFPNNYSQASAYNPTMISNTDPPPSYVSAVQKN